MFRVFNPMSLAMNVSQRTQATPIAKISHRGLHWLIWTWLWCHCGGLFRCFNWIGKNHGPWRLESWIFKIQQSFWHMFSDIGDPITSFTWWPNPGGRVSPPGAGDFMLDFFFSKVQKDGGPQDSVQLSYKWLNSMVYGRYSELEFMGVLSWLTNKHNCGAPSCRHSFWPSVPTGIPSWHLSCLPPCGDPFRAPGVNDLRLLKYKYI